MKRRNFLISILGIMAFEGIFKDLFATKGLAVGEYRAVINKESEIRITKFLHIGL